MLSVVSVTNSGTNRERFVFSKMENGKLFQSRFHAVSLKEYWFWCPFPTDFIRRFSVEIWNGCDLTMNKSMQRWIFARRVGKFGSTYISSGTSFNFSPWLGLRKKMFAIKEKLYIGEMKVLNHRELYFTTPILFCFWYAIVSIFFPIYSEVNSVFITVRFVLPMKILRSKRKLAVANHSRDTNISRRNEGYFLKSLRRTWKEIN